MTMPAQEFTSLFKSLDRISNIYTLKVYGKIKNKMWLITNL